jgi:hypothetical protein
MSTLPNRYSFLDWNPEPEPLSRVRSSLRPPSTILPRPWPQEISASWKKLPACAVATVQAIAIMPSAKSDLISNINRRRNYRDQRWLLY